MGLTQTGVSCGVTPMNARSSARQSWFTTRTLSYTVSVTSVRSSRSLPPACVPLATRMVISAGVTPQRAYR